MKIYSSIVLILLSFLLHLKADASHMIGGDVYYKCVGNNKFEITIVLYQDCLDGVPEAIFQDVPIQFAVYKGNNSSPTYFNAIYSVDSAFVPPNFSNDCINNFPNTCLRRVTGKTIIELMPSTEPYYIIYQRCCRNATINNIATPGNVGVTYYATIPPFSNGECPNNSATFNNFPPQIICNNNPFTYDFSASDIDGDSLSYELCSAFVGASTENPIPVGPEISSPPFTPVTYLPPYSPSNPLTALPPIQIDPETGILSMTPKSMGRFIVTVCVAEWRNGEKINSFSRDVQFIITNCSKSVVADIPVQSDIPNTFKVVCDGYTVDFINSSKGGFSYFWDFGVPGATSTAFEPTYTYPDTGTYEVTLIVNPGSTCVDSIKRLVKIYPYLEVSFEIEGKLCPEEEITFTNTSTNTLGEQTSWVWDFDNGGTASGETALYTYDTGGNYNVSLIVKTEYGCVDTVVKNLFIYPLVPNAGNDTIIVLNYPHKMKGSGGTFYRWEPTDYLDDPNDPNTKTHFPDVGFYNYVLHVSSENGCQGTDTIRIQVVKEGGILIPNAFSPNGDGLNDFFEVLTVGYSRLNYLHIFNRWGQRLYISYDLNRGWDGTFNGKPVEGGVYFYVLSATDAFGKEDIKKGDLTLIR